MAAQGGPAEAPAGLPAGAVRFIVVCPLRRELQHSMFSDTRMRLVRAGVPVDSIQRGWGLDVQHLPSVRPCHILMLYFDIRFRHMARRAFARHPELRALFWVEDDCQPRDAFSLTAVLAAVEEASPAVAWLGWIPRQGEPRWGSHLLGFTRASLAALEADLHRRRLQAGVTARRRQTNGDIDTRHCIAIDTWIYHLTRDQPPGAVAHVPSLARQRNHPLRSRR